jgi:DNA glycosylase AlkZ-like
MSLISESKLRAWWFHQQGLDQSLKKESARQVLRRTGWARSVGGVGPYLTIFARNGQGREQIDRAAANLEIHELPSARGCTYVVPKDDFAVALLAGREFGGTELKTAVKLGVKQSEIDNLCSAVLKALENNPLEPEALRQVVGGAVRNLGEEGKKKGLSTTLPVALGILQTTGDIRRVPTNGRLDQQRYRYTLWRQNPLAGVKTGTEINIELARRFFQWIGPASLSEFRWFSGLGAKVCRDAMEPLELVKVNVNRGEEDRWISAEDLEALNSFTEPKVPNYVLVSGLDGIAHLRRDVRSLLAPGDLKRKVFVEKGFREVGDLKDLPSHGIFDRGRLVGLWVYDTTTHSIAWNSFVTKDKRLETAVKCTEDYIGEHLGDARSFSLDSPKSRVAQIKALSANSDS